MERARRFRRGGGGRGLALSVAVALCLAATGCARIPFAQPELVPLGDVQPDAVRQRSARALPSRFLTEDALVFHFPFHKLGGLGYTRVDRERDTFELVFLTHMGLKLFHIEGRGQQVRIRYAIPQFAKRSDLLEAIAFGVRQAYLEQIPPADAKPLVEDERIIFRRRGSEGVIDYIYGGRDRHLLQKRFRQGRRQAWQVSFYEYCTKPDGRFPRGIVISNRKHHYRLIVRNRAWRKSEPAPADP